MEDKLETGPVVKTNSPSESEPQRAHRQVSFADTFRFWVKLGFISFGGPAGQIAIMHRELVERRHWISEERFLHALNYCMLLPGPEAQQLAIYIGWLMHRTPGGIVAGAFFVIPSILILLALSYTYAAYGNLPAIAGILGGFKPVVVAIVSVVGVILNLALVFGATVIWPQGLHGGTNWLAAAMSVAAFVALYRFRADVLWVVLAGGLIGLFRVLLFR